jgi:DNA-directed RNA polymerase specialized sigma54-like protein
VEGTLSNTQRKKSISNQTKNFIDKLLLEKLSLAGIARVTGVSEKCLQDYVNTKYAQTPRQVFLNSKKRKNRDSR